MAHKRWIAACEAAEVRVVNLGRSLRVMKGKFQRGEIGASDHFRRMADKIDVEIDTLNRLFVENQPPLEGHADARTHYRARQDRIHATIREITLSL